MQRFPFLNIFVILAVLTGPFSPFCKVYGTSGSDQNTIWICTSDGWKQVAFDAPAKGAEDRQDKDRQDAPVHDQGNEIQSCSVCMARVALDSSGLPILAHYAPLFESTTVEHLAFVTTPHSLFDQRFFDARAPPVSS